MTYRAYTDKQMVQACVKVKSMAGFLRAIGLRPTGGNYQTAKRNLQRLKVDCSHWTGQAWNKNQQLKDWSQYQRSVNLKPHLIKERGHKCEECKRTKWFQLPIPLELHHIDGDPTNNRERNLVLLCCNCHAQTDNWKRKLPRVSNSSSVLGAAS